MTDRMTFNGEVFERVTVASAIRGLPVIPLGWGDTHDPSKQLTDAEKEARDQCALWSSFTREADSFANEEVIAMRFGEVKRAMMTRNEMHNHRAVAGGVWLAAVLPDNGKYLGVHEMARAICDYVTVMSYARAGSTDVELAAASSAGSQARSRLLDLVAHGDLALFTERAVEAAMRGLPMGRGESTTRLPRYALEMRPRCRGEVLP